MKTETAINRIERLFHASRYAYLSPLTIAQMLRDVPIETVRKTLWRLAARGVLRHEDYGRFCYNLAVSADVECSCHHDNPGQRRQS